MVDDRLQGQFSRRHSITVRLLRPDVAIARATSEITYNAGMDRRTSTPLFVLTKSGGQWLIVAVQNTLTSAPSVQPIGNR
jgi:hypothetical protein